MYRIKTVALLCALLLFLSSMVSSDAAEFLSGVYTADVTLYVPDFLSAEFHERKLENVEISTRIPLEKTLLTMLLEEISDTVPDSFAQLRDLTVLPPGYVQSRDTALIHLSGEVLALDPLSRFTLCQAITNTICGPGEIKSCLIISDGRALSLDEARSIPTGVFAPNEYADPLTAMSQLLLRHSESETTNLHYRANTALFYPVSAGHGIICEVKALTYTSDSLEFAVRTILAALSETSLFDVPALPPLNEYLIMVPHLETIADNDNILVLSFDAELSNVLSEFGVLRSVLMASITLSLQGYFPWINGVRCEIGEEPILAIVPVGLYEGANEAISFERGYMLWQDFSHFILTDDTYFFFNNAGQLCETHRYIPSEWTNDPQRRLEQLFSGPSYYDSVTDLQPIYAGSKTIEEMINSIVSSEDRINLDFKEPVWLGDDLFREQSTLYAIVNTMTSLQWCRRVLVTVNGKVPEGGLLYTTPFMRSMDYIPDSAF